LRVSQGTNFFASRTEASTSSAASVTGGGSVNDQAAAAQAVQDALDINWLLRVLGEPGEESPMRPAAGDQNQQPPNPQGEDQDPEECVQSGVVNATFVNAMFAEQSYEESGLTPGASSLLAPELTQVRSDRETRLNAGWALLTAAIGIRATLPDERERKRLRL
jgi:hypothetical protein